jgi:hypothetical protein
MSTPVESGHGRVAQHVVKAVSVAQVTVQTSLSHIEQVQEDYFDPESCDAREKALITQLRSLLRPIAAPECLIERIEATLDRCCVESGREISGKDAASTTATV